MFRGEGLCGKLRSLRIYFKAREATGVKARVKTVLLMCSEPGTGRVARWYTKSAGFSKDIKKPGSLIMGDRGLALVLG